MLSATSSAAWPSAGQWWEGMVPDSCFAAKCQSLSHFWDGPAWGFVGLVGALKSSQNDSLHFRMVGIVIPVILGQYTSSSGSAQPSWDWHVQSVFLWGTCVSSCVLPTWCNFLFCYQVRAMGSDNQSWERPWRLLSAVVFKHFFFFLVESSEPRLSISTDFP